ncbi:EAL domain-containing protein [Deefgea sp. CFH1-16]|uniref:EAL domain-containing protein n=1 Tax=Deefgea sp. CFH1-16 TaxID=2675457 RepID=UPI0015F3A6C2|nr:EAL domain-containing protein [Deefgea sp. CFH1-16]MBM5573822.1 EAL domain-containing protein [Deefgea sp. CFH1-16]
MIRHSSNERYCAELADIIQQQQLSAVFQPIAALNQATAYGFEGLIRGPSGHPLHGPQQLFQAAEQSQCLPQLDRACHQVIIQAFIEQQLPGKLFLNVCPLSLMHATFHADAMFDFMHAKGLDPSRVVIELTETQATCDYGLMTHTLQHYREMGFQIALDDLGEGYSSLRLWSELKPDFVKIDKYFIQGISRDREKTPICSLNPTYCTQYQL